MADKIARLGIERDNDLMYYIKNGDVWAVPRKQKGKPKGKPEKVASTGLELDYSKYLYFLDGDGDVARKARALGGGRKKIHRKVKSPTPHPVAAAPASSAPRGRKKKGDAEIEREIEECLAKVRKKHGNGTVSGARKKRR